MISLAERDWEEFWRRAAEVPGRLGQEPKVKERQRALIQDVCNFGAPPPLDIVEFSPVDFLLFLLP